MHEHLLTFFLTFLCSHWCAQCTLDSVIKSRGSRIVCDSHAVESISWKEVHIAKLNFGLIKRRLTIKNF